MQAMATRLNMQGEGGTTCSGCMIYIVRKITQMKSDKPGNAKTYCREDGQTGYAQLSSKMI